MKKDKDLFINTWYKNEQRKIKSIPSLQEKHPYIDTVLNVNANKKSPLNGAHFIGRAKLIKKEPNSDCITFHHEGKLYAPHCSVGVMNYSNKHIYNGSWLNGMPHGIGYYKDPKLFEYDGQWFKGLMQGWGEMKSYDTGISYIGEFKNNKYHGLGTTKDKKEILRGYFKNDVLYKKLDDYKVTKDDKQFTY